MSVKTRRYIKTRFENGDVPTEQDFIDLIDSYFHLTEDQKKAGLTEFKPEVYIAKGRVVIKDAQLFQANQDHQGPWDDSHFDLIEPGSLKRIRSGMTLRIREDRQHLIWGDVTNEGAMQVDSGGELVALGGDLINQGDVINDGDIFLNA